MQSSVTWTASKTIGARTHKSLYPTHQNPAVQLLLDGYTCCCPRNLARTISLDRVLVRSSSWVTRSRRAAFSASNSFTRTAWQHSHVTSTTIRATVTVIGVLNYFSCLEQEPCCDKETARCSVFPTPHDSLIIICFRFRKVKAVIAPA